MQNVYRYLHNASRPASPEGYNVPRRRSPHTRTPFDARNGGRLHT